MMMMKKKQKDLCSKVNMNWKKLNDFECPKCGEQLVKKVEQMVYGCSSCEFTISPEKFDILVKKSLEKENSRYIEDEYTKNLRDLNNYGR